PFRLPKPNFIFWIARPRPTAKQPGRTRLAYGLQRLDRMRQIFFDNTFSLIRTLIIGVLAYICLITLLRVSGKRTLSKMNAFDFVVTVALGSTLATVLLSKDVTLAQGTMAFAVLIGLQFVITWTSVRMRWVRKLVTGEPSLLLHRGKFLQSELRRTRVTEDEILAAVRSAGLSAVEEVAAVVLETDGSFSVVGGNDGPNATTVLNDVHVTGAELPDRHH
ncbi:MAG: DUF421 domain-containing protein, partial [Planctomycetales bacterium]|nr:DUF421 domain-containing protein [Planctomycetales bacterium]